MGENGSDAAGRQLGGTQLAEDLAEAPRAGLAMATDDMVGLRAKENSAKLAAEAPAIICRCVCYFRIGQARYECEMADKHATSSPIGSIANYVTYFTHWLLNWSPSPPLYDDDDTDVLDHHHLSTYLTQSSARKEQEWSGWRQAFPAKPLTQLSWLNSLPTARYSPRTRSRTMRCVRWFVTDYA